jgi:hypothetical protein
VLKYVQNKDVFMRYHKAHLTRRLILDTSADSEKEENMVEWLREVGMPADYVNKLARMFQDIKVSQDLNQQFKEQCRAAIADSINIKVCFAPNTSSKLSFLLFIFTKVWTHPDRRTLHLSNQHLLHIPKA